MIEIPEGWVRVEQGTIQRGDRIYIPNTSSFKNVTDFDLGVSVKAYSYVIRSTNVR